MTETALDGPATVLVEQHLGVAEDEARRYLRRAPPWVDRGAILSHAHLGLCRAALTYDARCGASFATWARRKARGAILDAVRAEEHTRRRADVRVEYCDGAHLDGRQGADASEAAVAALDVAFLLAAVGNPLARQVVWLHHVEGWTLREAGDMLGRSEAWASIVARGARAAMRSRL
jgi:RNA polymerase sigma factor (sigma-70 family)